MGCYGVGVSRTMAAAIEQNYDDNGIIWPIEIAPYHVLVVPVNTKDEASAAKAEEIYMQLKKVGLETVIDAVSYTHLTLPTTDRLSAARCSWAENID